MEHLTGYNRPKLIRDHLWEHKCSNTKYVLYNKISEQKSPLSGTSISLGCHSKYMYIFWHLTAQHTARLVLFSLFL